MTSEWTKGFTCSTTFTLIIRGKRGNNLSFGKKRKTKNIRSQPMPSIEKHADISKQRTGKSYQQVHEWIDDPQHKEERHDITRVLEFSRMFREKYGEEAAREYVQHLADDLTGKFNHLVEDVQVLVDKTLAYFGAKKN
jgi:hypothetical protein